jgi:hypothetical protein
MSFFEKSPPDPKTSFFSEISSIDIKIPYFYFISLTSGCEPFPAKVYIRIIVFLSS